ncbi:DNA polymerase I [Cucumis melo var. makuwa]|uniref:DNA polymerase I n=1 Tax=Cucumis melo var. makuwa TaxID=1194695 RepID=A0A5A7V9Z3_CUCMM|nr:DNA polymerase I [Cucumis melo var. makuwa]TYK27385.1 DNA polymerase I [Cucumis melo var. makuwa]
MVYVSSQVEDGYANDKFTLIAIPMTEDKSSKDSASKENYQVFDKRCNVMPHNLPKSLPPRSTFRHTIYPAYKSNRAPVPDTIVQGLQYLKASIKSMSVKVIEVPGVEADDVIGTLALRSVAVGCKVRVVSPDKDFFQILSPSLRLLRIASRGIEGGPFGGEGLILSSTKVKKDKTFLTSLKAQHGGSRVAKLISPITAFGKKKIVVSLKMWKPAEAVLFLLAN